mmetsp:Transcript_41805/g.116584  ORF Transcript_41805/g.116584 Transcript_41805/m.116584 type:complete len:206 (-) Transcript_41805:75-692(-)
MFRSTTYLLPQARVPAARAVVGALDGRRHFARRVQHRDRPVPVAMPLEQAPDPSRDWSQGRPPLPARVGGYPQRGEKRRAGGSTWVHRGAVPRLQHLWVPGEGQNHSPFDDPNTPPAGVPLEPERPAPPWKVLRTHNGNLPVYLRVSYQGAVVTTLVAHFYGDVEHMRKELMRICEAPVRIRCSKFEIRGLHTWKIKEWLTSLGM